MIVVCVKQIKLWHFTIKHGQLIGASEARRRRIHVHGIDSGFYGSSSNGFGNGYNNGYGNNGHINLYRHGNGHQHNYYPNEDPAVRAPKSIGFGTIIKAILGPLKLHLGKLISIDWLN